MQICVVVVVLVCSLVLQPCNADHSDDGDATVKALEVSGHETPIPVGLTSNITCSTHLEVVRMEWVAVAVGNAVEEREDGGQSLVLPLTPTTSDLNDTEYTCMITTTGGKTFSETITVEMKAIRVTIEIDHTPLYGDYLHDDFLFYDVLPLFADNNVITGEHYQYTSPDASPHHSPPNYRTASYVRMRCVASGTTGSVSYRWNSTCSDCFVASYHNDWSRWRSSISTSFLTVSDAGEHTCYVRDDAGNTGSNTTTMNIVGAGTYIYYNHNMRTSNSGSRRQRLANNGVVIPTNRDYYSSSVSFRLYCCSNTSLPTGNLTVPSGHNEGRFRDGCYQFSFNRYISTQGDKVNLSSYGYSGVFTCNIRDTEGNEFNSNIGVYDPGYDGRPSISGMSCNSSSSTSITLVCSTRDAPPSSIKWYRDDTLVDINGNSTDMSVRLTNRTSSYFEIALQISNSLDGIVGNYRCEVGNTLGNDTQSYSVYRTTGVRVQFECSQNEFVVGETVNCSCSSNKESSSNKWYRGNSSIPLISEDGAQLTIPVTTDIEGEIYTCSVFISCWEWKDTITVSVTVPDDWATVEITNSTNQNALLNTNYVLTCTVMVIDGMNLDPSLEWVGPDGTVLVSTASADSWSGSGSGSGSGGSGFGSDSGSSSTLTLSFNPVLSSHGGRYTCRAAISVPWMATQPPQHSASVDMPVTSQALFQLRLYPSALCANLDVDKALDLESSIKRDVETAVRERCDCDFSSTAIYSGKFSCDLASHVTYRAILNGTSDLLTADQLMEHIQDWRETRGTLLHDILYLNLASASECTVKINSFEDDKCSA